MIRPSFFKTLDAMTAQQVRAGRPVSVREGRSVYVFTAEEREEQERVRQLNIARGVQHLVDERNALGNVGVH